MYILRKKYIYCKKLDVNVKVGHLKHFNSLITEGYRLLRFTNGRNNEKKNQCVSNSSNFFENNIFYALTAKIGMPTTTLALQYFTIR